MTDYPAEPRSDPIGRELQHRTAAQGQSTGERPSEKGDHVSAAVDRLDFLTGPDCARHERWEASEPHVFARNSAKTPTDVGDGVADKAEKGHSSKHPGWPGPRRGKPDVHHCASMPSACGATASFCLRRLQRRTLPGERLGDLA